MSHHVDSLEREQTLLTRLLAARGPGGQEDEVRAICLEELRPYCDDIWVDAAGNVIGVIGADSCSGEAPQQGIALMAHMDEIAMVVKRVEPDGTLRVIALGGANPVNFGMCPVEILADDHLLPGVLSFGSMHETSGSLQGKDVQSGAVKWADVHVITRQSPDTLKQLGVRPGVRVVLSKHWRTPWRVNDATAAHFMDDRAPVAAVLQAAQALAARRGDLSRPVYFVFTTLEEESNAGAAFAASSLPCEVAIAVEVGPVVDEYGTELSVNPIINTGDQKGYYTRCVATDLARAAERCGYVPQFALLVDFASDASAVMGQGTAAKAGCLAIPTENTHGYEMVLDGAITACADTLVAYLTAPAAS